MTKRPNVLWFGKELPGVCTRETYRNVSVVERGKSIVFIIQELGTLNCQVTDPVQTKAAFIFYFFFLPQSEWRITPSKSLPIPWASLETYLGSKRLDKFTEGKNPSRLVWCDYILKESLRPDKCLYILTMDYNHCALKSAEHCV